MRLCPEWRKHEADRSCHIFWPGCRGIVRIRRLYGRYSNVFSGESDLGSVEPGRDGLCHRHLRVEAALGLEWNRDGVGGRIDLLLLTVYAFGAESAAVGEFLCQWPLRADDRVLHDQSLQAAVARFRSEEP